MRILGFAHATFVSENMKTCIVPGQFFQSFPGIHDSEVKTDWLRNKVGNHNIDLYQGHLPIELVYYPNTPKETERSNATFETFIDSNSTIRSSSFSPEFFKFITFFCRQAIVISETKLVINQLSLGKSVTFEIDPLGERMGEYLDDPGLSALAFFVDSTSQNALGDYPFFKANDKFSANINLTLGQNSFVIAFIKIQGVNIEFISRVERNRRS